MVSASCDSAGASPTEINQSMLVMHAAGMVLGQKMAAIAGCQDQSLNSPAVVWLQKLILS